MLKINVTLKKSEGYNAPGMTTLVEGSFEAVTQLGNQIDAGLWEHDSSCALASTPKLIETAAEGDTIMLPMGNNESRYICTANITGEIGTEKVSLVATGYTDIADSSLQGTINPDTKIYFTSVTQGTEQNNLVSTDHMENSFVGVITPTSVLRHSYIDSLLDSSNDVTHAALVDSVSLDAVPTANDSAFNNQILSALSTAARDPSTDNQVSGMAISVLTSTATVADKFIGLLNEGSFDNKVMVTLQELEEIGNVTVNVTSAPIVQDFDAVDNADISVVNTIIRCLGLSIGAVMAKYNLGILNLQLATTITSDELIGGGTPTLIPVGDANAVSLTLDTPATKKAVQAVADLVIADMGAILPLYDMVINVSANISTMNGTIKLDGTTYPISWGMYGNALAGNIVTDDPNCLTTVNKLVTDVTEVLHQAADVHY